MSLRISSAVLGGVLGLAACAPAAAPLPGEAVECAIGKASTLAFACTLEREPTAGRIVLHHPDGGFRRLSFDPETRALTAADGAERVSNLASEGDHLVFALGKARYRVPLQLLAGAP